MKTKIFTLLLALVASVGTIFAEKVQIGDLYYDLDAEKGTASVTSSSGGYSGAIVIPRSIWYDNKNYSVTSIGDYAFSTSMTLTSVEIPNSVTSIGDYAFSMCPSLTSITIPNSVISIGRDAFSYCDLTSVTIGNSVTSIGDYAFSGCTGLTSVTIPNSVTSIGEQAFSGCTGLTSVIIGNSVTRIGDYAFSMCFGLTSVTIPNSVTSIGDNAFYNCASLTSITIPSSVNSIGNYAFQGCSSLTSVTIPNSVTSIGEDAFLDIPNIVYYGTATGSPWGARNLNGYVDGYLVYKDATKTKLCACSSSAQGEITIPNSVTSIGERAFEMCTSLTSVTIPNSVTSIENSAFSGCESLTSITFPNSVTSIGGGVFNGCISLTAPIYNAHIFAYLPTSYSGAYTIPYGIETIAPTAFSMCTGLTSVTIPNSVTSIGIDAFSGCDGLTAPVYNEHIFACLPRSYSGAYTIPYGIETIAPTAFSMCTGLTSITIPNSVTSIGLRAFDGCKALTSVTIPNSVTSIGVGAFWFCDGLTAPVYNEHIFACLPRSYSGAYTIPDGIESIAGAAFGGCYGLTSISIPNSVTNIGYWAFSGCKALTSVTCKAVTPPILEEDSYYRVFDEVSKTIPVYVPAVSVDAYQNWGGFTNIQPLSAEYASVTTNTTSDITENSVTISWPQVIGANEYMIEIRLNNVVVCTVTFNNQGQLLSIIYKAPSRSGKRENMAAQALTDGWKYTVNGLDAGKTYTYSVIAKNAYGSTIDTKSGTFTTGEPQGIEDVLSPEKATKVLHNGQVLILRGEKVYSIDGRKVK